MNPNPVRHIIGRGTLLQTVVLQNISEEVRHAGTLGPQSGEPPSHDLALTPLQKALGFLVAIAVGRFSKRFPVSIEFDPVHATTRVNAAAPWLPSPHARSPKDTFAPWIMVYAGMA